MIKYIVIFILIFIIFKIFDSWVYGAMAPEWIYTPWHDFDVKITYALWGWRH